jgi:hypothetical protein
MAKTTKKDVKVTGEKRTFEYEEIDNNKSGKDRDVSIEYTRLIPDGTSVLVQAAAKQPTKDDGAKTLDAEHLTATVTVKDGEKLWARLEPKLSPNALQLTYE